MLAVKALPVPLPGCVALFGAILHSRLQSAPKVEKDEDKTEPAMNAANLSVGRSGRGEDGDKLVFAAAAASFEPARV